MTDQATPLTQEALRDAMERELDALLVDAHAVPDEERVVWAQRLAAAARRAIEGSGVVTVEALSVALHDIEHPGYPRCYRYRQGDERSVCQVKAERILAHPILAALPRPEESRVERCFIPECDELPDDHHHPLTPEAR